MIHIVERPRGCWGSLLWQSPGVKRRRRREAQPRSGHWEAGCRPAGQSHYQTQMPEAPAGSCQSCLLPGQIRHQRLPGCTTCQPRALLVWPRSLALKRAAQSQGQMLRRHRHWRDRRQRHQMCRQHHRRRRRRCPWQAGRRGCWRRGCCRRRCRCHCRRQIQ